MAEQHWALESLPQKEQDTGQNFQQHLCRLFGQETAEYFLSPSLMDTSMPLWFRQMIDSMGDEVSGEVLWDSLREASNARLMKIVGNCPQSAFQAGEATALARQQQPRSHLRRLALIRLMFQSARLSQAHATLFLSQNPLPELSDPWGLEGPHRYLPQERKVHQGPFKEAYRHRQTKVDTGFKRSPNHLIHNSYV